MDEIQKAKLFLWFALIVGFLIAFFFTGVALTEGQFFILGFALVGILIMFAGINNYKSKSSGNEIITSKEELLRVIEKRSVTTIRYIASILAFVAASLALTFGTINSSQYYSGVEHDFCGSIVIFGAVFLLVFAFMTKLRNPKNNPAFITVRDHLNDIVSVQVLHHRQSLLGIIPLTSVRWLILKVRERKVRIWVKERQVVPMVKQLLELNNSIEIA